MPSFFHLGEVDHSLRRFLLPCESWETCSLSVPTEIAVTVRFLIGNQVGFLTGRGASFDAGWTLPVGGRVDIWVFRGRSRGFSRGKPDFFRVGKSTVIIEVGAAPAEGPALDLYKIVHMMSGGGGRL